MAGALLKLSKDRGSQSAYAPAAVRHSQESLALPQNPYLSRPKLRPDDDPEIARYKTEVGRNYARQVIAMEKAVERKDYMTVFGLANSALATYADNPRVLSARAVAAWNFGDYRTAAADATLVLKAHPDAYAMLLTRAAAYNDMGRHAEALQDADNAAALVPHNSRALLERAIAREALNEPAGNVIEDFRRAAELDPKYKPDYEQALVRLNLMGSDPGLAKEAQPEPQRQKFAASPSHRSARPSLPWAMAGLAGLACLAAAGFILIRRS